MDIENNKHSLPNKLLSKGSIWGLSKIGAPLEPTEEMHKAAEGAHELDLREAAPSTPPLASDCKSLSRLVPKGYKLRALGAKSGDRLALFEHWRDIGPEARRTRFFFSPSLELLRKRAFDLDFINPRFAGLFDEQGQLACVAEWAFDGPGEAEAAFSTLPDHRRKGLAKIAAAACALDAREQGVMRLRIDTLRENKAAQALAQSLGGSREAGSPEGWNDCVSSYIDLSQTGQIENRLGLIDFFVF